MINSNTVALLTQRKSERLGANLTLLGTKTSESLDQRLLRLRPTANLIKTHYLKFRFDMVLSGFFFDIYWGKLSINFLLTISQVPQTF